MRRIAVLTAALAAYSSPAAAQYAGQQTLQYPTTSTTRLPSGQTIVQTAPTYGGGYGYGGGGAVGGGNFVRTPQGAFVTAPGAGFGQGRGVDPGQVQSQPARAPESQPEVALPPSARTVDDMMTQGVVRGSSQDPSQNTAYGSTSGSASAAAAVPAGQRFIGQARAVDGDTIVLMNRTIALHGVDAPELDQACNDLRNMPWRCGLKARAKLQSFIQDKTVACVTMKTESAAIVATCRAAGADLSELMTASGFAVSVEQGSQPYRRFENDAAAARRGVWAGTFNRPYRHRLVRR